MHNKNLNYFNHIIRHIPPKGVNINLHQLINCAALKWDQNFMKIVLINDCL